MGQSVSAFRKLLTAGDEESKNNVMQQLMFLVNSANAILDKYESEMKQDFLNNASAGKTAIPGLRALKWERGYRVGVSSQATKGIGEIVDTFFSDPNKADEQDPKTSSEVEKPKTKKESPNVTGFKKVIEVALQIILGNSTVGQQETKKFFVFVHHNAIIRIDLKVWRYNFEGRGVMAQSENVLAYICCTSVVRHDTLEIDELVYLLSEHAGDKNVNAYLAFLLQTWENMRAIKDNPTKGIADGKLRIPADKDVPIPKDDVVLADIPGQVTISSGDKVGDASKSGAGTGPEEPVGGSGVGVGGGAGVEGSAGSGGEDSGEHEES